MKMNVRTLVRGFREGFVRVLKQHPVEMLLVLYGCIASLIAYETNWEDSLPVLILAPLFTHGALVVNILAGRGPWRKIYWICWTPILPLSFWGGLESWVESMPFVLTACVVIPLALLLCRCAVRNERFVADAVIWLRSALLALIFANVALGLFCAILYSTVYIFDFAGAWTGHTAMYALIIAQMLVMPTLFLMSYDRSAGAECRGGRIVEVLLDYIVTPALLVYTVILGLYLLKILFSWSLPRGGVAYLVFGFMLTALCVQALQLVLRKRRYNWFFDRFSLISLPALVLFWTGVLRRVGEYGLTESRVLLVVCGLVMTLWTLLFFSRYTGRYLFLCAAAFLCFGALAYIPALHPERIAVRSQVKRAALTAEKLGLLSPEGHLQLRRMPADTLLRRDYRTLYESLDFVADRDSVLFSRFGIDMDAVREAIPNGFYDYVVYGYNYSSHEMDDESFLLLAPSCRKVENLVDYRMIYEGMPGWDGGEAPYYTFRNDTLRICFGKMHPTFVIAGADLLRMQLQKVKIDDLNPQKEMLEAVSDPFLNYADEEVMIFFRNMEFERDSILRLTGADIDFIMTR